MFAGSGLENIRLPSTLMVLEKETFGACKNLTRIEIPESLKYIESGVFRESGL